MFRTTTTPLGTWRFSPQMGIHILDTEGPTSPWKPLVVSIALTSECHKGCSFCYASAQPDGSSTWNFDALIEFITDLDKHGVFCVALGGGEPSLWRDQTTGQTFYELIATLSQQTTLALTFTTAVPPSFDFAAIPPVAARISCHTPGAVRHVLMQARQLRRYASHVGINLLLWRRRLNEVAQAIHQFLQADFQDILLLNMQPTGRGLDFADERVPPEELGPWLRSLGVDFMRLAACEQAPALLSSDMGCGAGDWFVSVSETQHVKSCSFIDEGKPLPRLSYEGLMEACLQMQRLPCYRAYHTPLETCQKK